MNILHTLPLPRSTWRLAALLCLLLAALTLSPTLVSANSPPGNAVIGDRDPLRRDADRHLAPAIADATGYDITYSSDGKKWAVAALNYPNTTITFRVKNSATYVVAVRARNAHGDSSWRKSSPSGPFVQTNPPEAPSSVTLTRSVGTLTATWPAVSDAADYHVTYTWNGGKRAGTSPLSTTQEPASPLSTPQTSRPTWSPCAPETPPDTGDWRSSDPIAPISPPVLAPFGLTATADDKSVNPEVARLLRVQGRQVRVPVPAGDRRDGLERVDTRPGQHDLHHVLHQDRADQRHRVPLQAARGQRRRRGASRATEAALLRGRHSL